MPKRVVPEAPLNDEDIYADDHPMCGTFRNPNKRRWSIGNYCTRKRGHPGPHIAANKDCSFSPKHVWYTKKEYI